MYLATGTPEVLPETSGISATSRGNIGDQNYELADDIDLNTYTTVFIWCVRFGVAFGAAPLT